MQNHIEALLQHSLEGHHVIARIHGQSPAAACKHVVGQMEMHKRGVRFLPAQVIKKAMRNALHQTKN